MKRLYLLLGSVLFMAPICHAADVTNCTSPFGTAGQSAVHKVARDGECAANLPLRTPAIAGAPTGEEETEAIDAPVPGPSAGPHPPLMASAAHLPSNPPVPMAGPAPPGLTPAVHSRKDKLQTGMSDLQVLNNRRWGKPQRITRSCDARAWHEQWRYETGANGGKQLHFINGMLASVDDLVPPAPHP